MADRSVGERRPRAAEPEEDPDEPVRVPLRLSRRGIVVLGSLGALLLAVIGWVIFFSSVLDVRVVAVQGLQNDQLTVDEVRQAVGPLQHGPLARVDLDAVEHRVQAIPRVARVEAWRGWPHTLRIKVIERQPVAAVKGPDGKFTQMDSSGVSFATADTPPAGVPVVQLQLSRAAQDAAAVLPEAELVRGAVRVAAGLPAEVAKQGPSLLVRSYDDIEIGLSNGVTIRWGSPDQTDRKAVVLQALMKQSAKVYDVTAPDAPAISS
ncbi:FtsQ-type POTRA domain-containing protein [Kitasatospora sp. RB6PN24]|uniref:cell division protein FtsQ/DivIB n=1 Tax=Kitasatospora humi TaxID=2893891 RepID=UPI001E41BA9C|nr:FtsQ-type POTRA domain-containing protein [Kitasatospora humi]MCC9312101.1 FtsQ-type POTRA domain-containing protein [Kitasatospora humi]